MILASMTDPKPIGLLADVKNRARELLGIDLAGDMIVVGGHRFEIALENANGRVACIHVVARGGIPGTVERGLLILAAAIGAKAFDSQTGREVGAPAPRGAPSRSAGRYQLQLVPLDDSGLGTVNQVWDGLERGLGATREDSSAAGEGWSVTFELVPSGGKRLASVRVQRVKLQASWRDARARAALFAAVSATAEAEGWVPFDPQQNDTL